MRALQLGGTTHLPPWRSWRPCAIALALSALAGGTLWAAPLADSSDCEARLEAAVQAISTHPRVKDIPRDKIKATTEFALGNTLFALMHEMAHGLITDLGLPVLGRLASPEWQPPLARSRRPCRATERPQSPPRVSIAPSATARETRAIRPAATRG